MTLSKPSKPAKPPTKAKRSTTSWTIPKPGDVLNFAYLWEHEKLQGLEEGLKERPSVVVLMVGGDSAQPSVTVVPVTSQKPQSGADHVEMPPNVKRHLGLTDRDHSYIMTTEINRFTWPGPYIRPFESKGRMEVCLGQIP